MVSRKNLLDFFAPSHDTFGSFCMGRLIMKKHNSEPAHVDAAAEIQALIDSIRGNPVNRTDNIYINIIHNEFITFPDEITIPRIPVKELDYIQGLDIMSDLVPEIPEFFIGHEFLKNRIPAAEEHSLHFKKKLQGKCLDFSHMFKIDLKFGGNPDTIIDKGNSDFYPSFTTNRIYYKSLLIPESTIHRTNTSPVIDPVRIQEIDEVESDQFFHTFAIFDETDRGVVTKGFYDTLDLPSEIFGLSPSLYPMLEYDYFTACFNVINPSPEELITAAEIFEPLFLLLYGRQRNLNGIVNPEAVQDYHHSLLKIKGQQIDPTDAFISLLKDYFHTYQFTRDDEMILKGWWKFEKEKPQA